MDMLERLKTKAYKVFWFIFHAGFKISNFNLWTAKHLMQASRTELALEVGPLLNYRVNKYKSKLSLTSNDIPST